MSTLRTAILEAADQLDGEGINPTLAAVRKKVGRGSYTTVSEVMNEWRAAKAAKQAPIAEPVPEAVITLLGDFAAELWRAAMAVANERLAAERADSEAARLQADQERTEAVDLADSLSADLDAERARVEALAASEAQLRADAVTLRAELAAATERANTASAKLEVMTARVDDLAAQLAHERELAELITQLSNIGKEGAKPAAGNQAKSAK